MSLRWKIYWITNIPVGILSETPCLKKAMPSLLMAQSLIQPPLPDSRPIDILWNWESLLTWIHSVPSGHLVETPSLYDKWTYKCIPISEYLSCILCKKHIFFKHDTCKGHLRSMQLPTNEFWEKILHLGLISVKTGMIFPPKIATLLRPKAL